MQNLTIKGAKVKKKILRIITSLVLVIALLFSESIISDAVVYVLAPSAAAGGDYTSNTLLADKLNLVFAGDIDIYFTSTGEEKSLPLGTRMDTKNQYYCTSKLNKYYSVYGWQCYIYANAVYNYLFNEPPSHGTGMTNSEIVLTGSKSASYSLFSGKNIMCGAYMRTTANSDGSYNGSNGHSLIILSYDENKISYLEGNGDGAGIVRIVTTTWSDFNTRLLTGRNRVINVVVQPKEDYFTKLYPETKIKFFYDGNGGTGTKMEGFSLNFNEKYTLAASTYTKSGYEFGGWNIKRTSDGAFATEDGKWLTAAQLKANNKTKLVYKNCRTFTFDSLFYGSTGEKKITATESFTLVAYWVTASETPAPTPVATTLSLNVGTGTVKQRESQSIELSVSENPGVAYLELSYNLPKGFTLNNVYNGEVCGAMISGTNSTRWQMSQDSTLTGILATLDIGVSGSVAIGTYEISVSVINCCGETGDKNYKVTGGIITVTVGDVECVSLDYEPISLNLGETKTLKATVVPANAENAAVKWSVSDSSVLSVNNGVIKALKAGVAVVTAEAGGYSAELTVTVACSHNLIKHAAQAPTAVSVGWDEYVTCSICGYTTYNELPAVVIPGDFDRDMEVSGSDMVYLYNAIKKTSGYNVNQSMDVSGDGVVNKNDVFYLMKSYLMPDKYPME